jgi:hypothetical protein
LNLMENEPGGLGVVHLGCRVVQYRTIQPQKAALHSIRERTLISRVRDGDGLATVGGSCGIAAVLALSSAVRAAHGESGESTFGACVGAVPSRIGGENCDGGGGRNGRRLTREGVAGLPGVDGDVGNRRTGLPVRGAAGLREDGD